MMMKIKMMLVGMFFMLSLLVDSLAAEGRKIDFLLVDKADSKPLAEVGLNIEYAGKDMQVKQVPGRTDIDGHYKLALPDDALGVRVRAVLTGYVPSEATWHNNGEEFELPDSYTMAIEKGTSIGGMVHDQNDKPISGVSVKILLPDKSQPQRNYIHDYEVITDAKGKWRCNIMPAELNEVLFQLKHEDYISDSVYGQTPSPSIELLRAMSGVMILKKGLLLEGVVTDIEGKPIAGAEVAQGSDRWGTDYPVAKTDDKGHYRFENVMPGRVVLTVYVPDGNGSGRSCDPAYKPTARAKAGVFYAPQLTEVDVTRESGPVNFTLAKGSVFKGRVVDKKGKPLADVQVTADTWQGKRTLCWIGKTDKKGYFKWESAPADEVLYDVGKQEYMYIRKQAMTASESDQEFVLLSALKVSGTVKDAKTGKAIKGAMVAQGLGYSWDDHLVNAGNGKYKAVFYEPRTEYRLRAEAEGYASVESRVIKADEGQVEINFALEKGTGPAGKVLNPDGSPATDATLAIYPTDGLSGCIMNGKIGNQPDQVEMVKAGPDGSFCFKPQTREYYILAVSEQGYAALSDKNLKAEPQIKLQQWATVEGRLMLGAKPDSQGRVHCQLGNLIFYSICVNSIQVDKDGYYIDRYVPANREVSIGKEVRLYQAGSNGYSTAISDEHTISLKPGEKITLDFGGIGRPVAGKVVNPTSYQGTIDWHYGNGAKLTNIESKTNYRCKVNSDGTFRFDDIPAGNYTLTVDAQKPDEKLPQIDMTIGKATTTVTVGEMPGNRSDEVLDIGQVEVKLGNK